MQVPNGFQMGNTWVRHVDIRELNGYDEELIASIQDYFPPFKTSLLLSRVAKFSNITHKLDVHQTVRNLSVGDRIALIIHLRKITFGTMFYCTIHCPSCKDKLSVDIPIDQLLQPVYTNVQTAYTIELEGYALKIRPITGLDLENIALNQNTSDLTEKLLTSCILVANPPLPKSLNNQLQEQISTELSKIDPQADLNLKVNCPNCNENFQIPIDIEDFFFKEVTTRYRQLEQEMHCIALHYNWDEKTILSLPLSKRKRYVELINTTLSGGNI